MLKKGIVKDHMLFPSKQKSSTFSLLYQLLSQYTTLLHTHSNTGKRESDPAAEACKTVLQAF